MQLEVVAKKENPLLKRVEVRFKAIHKAEPTPTRDALRAFLAKELKATKDVVVIDHQASSFGRYETLGYAKIYKSKEEAESIERRHILVRNRLAEAEVKEKEGAPKPEKPALAPKAEKPAPAPKPEAPKAEAKPEKAPAKEEKKPAEKKEPGEKKASKKEEKPEAKKAEPKKKEAK